MAAKANIKRQREEQLYAQGLTVTQIAERLRVSHQAVSKLLNLKANPKLRREHDAHYGLDEELRAGEDGPRIRERGRELYAQGLTINFIAEQLGRPRQVVAEMIEGDVELGRQHAARVALDRKLIGGEPATTDDISVDHRDGLPEDRGGAESRSATRSATEERPDVQPGDPAGCGGREVCDDNRGDPTVNGAPTAEATEQRPTTNATEEPPAMQPRNATAERDGATTRCNLRKREVQPQDATAERPEMQPPRRQQRNLEKREMGAAAAEKIVQQVIEQVRVAYGYYPDQFTSKDPSPQLEEAWQAAMFIASRVTGLSFAQLGEVFGCGPGTVEHACNEIVVFFTVDETLRGRILSTEARIREEFGIPRIISG